MKQLITAFTILFALSSCAQTPKKDDKVPASASGKPLANESIATFAQGCFWHTEEVFQSLVGVREAVSGYSGGVTENPTYEQVVTGQTGYAESVQVYYDPSKISFETLVKAYFASMDPTTLNRQGNDVGTQYRSIAFYRNENERKIIEAEINRINGLKKYKNKIVTELVFFKKFYAAEAYHQEFIKNNPWNSYAQNVCKPAFIKFKKEFKGNFKKED